MPTFAAGSVRVRTPASYDARSASPRSDRGLPGDPEGITVVSKEVLVAALEGSDLALVERVDLVPRVVRSLEAAVGPAVGPAVGAANRADTVAVEVDVAPEQDAVVLLERDGVYSWHLPVGRAQRTRALEPGPRTARFEIQVQPRPTTGPRKQKGLLGDLVHGAAQVLVFRFVAPALLERAVDTMEALVRPGLIQITDTDVSRWKRFETLDQLHLPLDRPVRLLLLVHGTFASTAGAFGALAVEQNGPGFLRAAIAAYDAVIGFDHKTLSLDPRQNAEDLLKRLRTHHPGAELVLDVVTHSRGGLVTRAFAEEVLPHSEWPGSVDAVVFVAATNAGTHLADPERWGDLLDLCTNLAAVTARSLALLPGGPDVATVVGGAVKGIGAFVKYLVSYAAEGAIVPGLEAMVPGGTFVTELNRTQPGQPGPGTNWYVVTSNFHVRLFDDHHTPPEFPRELVAQLAEGFVDRILEGDNDLVVDTSSMSAIDRTVGGFVRETLDLGANDVVYHTNYFHQRSVLEAMAGWLPLGLGAGGGPETAALELAAPPAVLPDSAPEALEAFPEAPDEAAMPATDVRWEVQRALTARRAARRLAPAGPARAGSARGTPASIAAEMAAQVVAKVQFAVRIRLSRHTIVADDGTAHAEADVVVDPDRPLSVQVIGKSNVRVLDPDSDVFEVPAGGGVSELEFQAMALAVGPAVVMVVVRQGRIPVATLSLDTIAVGETDLDAMPLETTVTASIHPGIDAPELEGLPCIDIVERELPNGTVVYQYAVRLLSGQPAAVFESNPIKDRVRRIGTILDDVADIWKESDQDPRERERQLQDIGAKMFDELFPEDMQAHLWKHRAKVKDLILYTDEAFVPWELVHLKQAKGPRPAKPRFLAQTGLVRWPLGSFPPREMRVRDGHARSLCPDYRDPRFALSEPVREREFLEERFGAKSVTATPAGVRSLLRSGSFDLLHFSGHGAADPDDILDAKLLLQGRRRGDTVEPQYLGATTVSENASWTQSQQRGPLVVLNACQAGQAGELLTTVGGFARAFLGAGASAFVSCLWSVRQEPSRLFVEKLYDELLAGTPMSTASARAREATRKAGDATWLSFVVYARPDAVLVRS